MGHLSMKVDKDLCVVLLLFMMSIEREKAFGAGDPLLVLCCYSVEWLLGLHGVVCPVVGDHIEH